MFVFTITVEPKPDARDMENVAGAYCVCWINFPLQDGAEHLAKFYIDQAGWIPKDIKRVVVVGRNEYTTEPELLTYFEEAEQDGASFVFHEWPSDAEDTDEDDTDSDWSLTPETNTSSITEKGSDEQQP